MSDSLNLSQSLALLSAETLEEILKKCDNVELRLCLLENLTESSEDLCTVEGYRTEILRTYRFFVEQLTVSLGEETKGIDDFVNDLIKEEILGENAEHLYDKVRKWEWPTIEVPESIEVTLSPYFEIPMYSVSALKIFGYTVGKTKGWSKFKREKFLTDFMELNLPKAVTRIYGEHYGKPNSPIRLRAIANLLAHNIVSRKRNDPSKYDKAISDWTSDLEFLHVNFYTEKKLRQIDWPDVEI